MRLLATVVPALISCRLAAAQIYTFDKTALPDPRSLHTLYAFYVYSHKDAPERTQGQPFVKFHSLVLNPKSPADRDENEHYNSVQLSILPYRSFWTLINPERFCSSEEDVTKGIATKANMLLAQKPPNAADDDVDVYSHVVGFSAGADTQLPVHSTGVYILIFSNCGSFSNAEIDGSVIVKNAYGFLPGNEYHKMPFYGWLSMAYAFMAMLWMCLSLRNWRHLLHFHYCIAGVILLGLMEAFLQWRFFMDWNDTGLRGRIVFILAILAAVVKSIFSYVLVLVASLGWGVTRPYLDHQTILKVQALTFCYTIMDFIREAALSFRHSHSLSLVFVMLCLLPVAMLNGIIFYWIFTSLSALMDTLKDRNQLDKLGLFQRLWYILVAALSLASFGLIFQLFDLSRSISVRWHHQWFFADGVSHILFCMVLAAIMYLWVPQPNSQRFTYRPVERYDKGDDSKKTSNPKDDWVDEAGLDEEEEQDSSTHVEAEIVGSKTTAGA